MFETLPPRVVAPTVASGTPVTLFAYLENSTMARAFRGRRPQGNPEFVPLSDQELSRRIANAVEAVGGRVGRIQIGPRPVASLPSDAALARQRLSRYTAAVKTTVATRFLKEKLGLQMVASHERTTARRFAWVLWTREDSHWFAPLQLARFARGAVHGKGCGGFGGWNDKVWLMDREWAEPMLTMYDAFHTAQPARCTNLAEGGGGGGGGASAAELRADFLAAPSVEQFRERVGKLLRIPFTKHSPDEIPTMDSYYLPRREQGGHGAAAETSVDMRGGSSGGAAAVDARSGWRLCFPRIYANGCVPKANQSTVDQMSCA